MSALGRDPAGIGRGRVTSVVRESGVRGVRRGGTSVTARPAKGRGRRARPRGTRVRGGGRPDRPHVAGIACVRMANGSFGCTAFAADVLARGIAGRACAAAMDTRGGAGAAGAGTGGIMGRLAWRHGRSHAPFRPWHVAHRPRVRHRGRGMRHASPPAGDGGF